MVSRKPALQTAELLLSATVFAIVIILFTSLQQFYPSWPTIGEIPVNPELIFPLLLGVSALGRAAIDGLNIWSFITGILSIITMLIALLSLQTLYSGSGGGVFFGGLFTLVSGSILAATVIAREAVEMNLHEKAVQGIRNQLGN